MQIGGQVLLGADNGLRIGPAAAGAGGGTSAATLLWVTNSADFTPGIEIGLPVQAAAGDTIHFEFKTEAQSWASATQINRVITVGDLNSGGYAPSVGTLAAGWYDCRVRLTLGGVQETGFTVSYFVLDITAPTITSGNAASVDENLPLAFTLTASEPVTFTLSGTDAASFDIAGAQPAVSATLIKIGNGTFDYEGPEDADGNNVYSFTITATDRGEPGLTANQAFTLTVNNVVEIGDPTIDNAIVLENDTDAIELEGSTDFILLE
jgi:hypothetical protein